VRAVVEQLRAGTGPQLLAATGTDGRGERAVGLARALNGLRSRLQVVK
jgi:hypothetical protein